MFPAEIAPANRKPMIPLGGQRIVGHLGLAAILAALVQLVLGASLSIVALALFASSFGLLSFAAFGPYNLGSWVALLYALGNVLFALYAKTMLGQPLESHLYAATDSFAAVAATGGALLAALLLVKRLRVGRPILSPTGDARFLARLSWACFALGVLFWLLNRYFQDPGATGFGGVATFRDLLFMAVIARTAALLERTEDRRTFDVRLGWIMAVATFLGLLDSSKTAAALPILSHFVTVLFYRRGLPARSVIVLVVGTLFFVVILAPVMHALRAMGQRELSISQRIDLVTSNFAEILEDPGRYDRLARIAQGQFKGGYYNYFGGNGANQMLLGRYASVQQIDPVIAEVNRSRPWGGEAIWPALARLVPRLIYPDKPKDIESFNTLVHYGLVSPDGGKFPTLPLAGQAYAAYGLLGLLTIPFITFFIFFLVVKKLGWHLYRNIYAIFFFCSFVVVYANQGDFGQYAGAVLRNFPLFAATFLILHRLCRIRLRQGGRSSLVHPSISPSEIHVSTESTGLTSR